MIFNHVPSSPSGPHVYELKAPRVQDSSRINFTKTHFLIVDDNERSLKILSELTRSFGVDKITTASSGDEAKELLSRQHFDLLLTDAHMPGCSGYELVRWLRNRPRDEDRIIPAIIISAHTREHEVAEGRDCGAHYIIAKPASPIILLERIYWIAEKQRSFIDAGVYVGPDRRWKNDAPPPEFADGRRAKDLSSDITEAVTANLSDDELAKLIQPQKAKP